MSDDCQKVKYENPSHARSAARLLTRDTGERFSSYRCARCGSWHVTTGKRHVDTPNRKTTVKAGRRPAKGQTIEDLAAEMRRRK